MQNDLIVVEQLPVITERLKQASADIDTRVAEAMSLVCTEDTVKQVKAVRSSLTSDFNALEEQRKTVKKSIMSPYEAFEAVYKEYVTVKYKGADADLKSKIDGVEGELKKRKRDDLTEYFNEYRDSLGIDFATMEKWNPNVTLSVTLTALKKEAAAYIDGISDALSLIETQEHKAEILVEYQQCMNVSQAITTVVERHKAMEQQVSRQAELETRKAEEAEAIKRVEAVIPAPLAPPVVKETVIEDPVRTLSFKVSAPMSKLKELKKYLDDGGFDYE